jgi:hypothetical protein
VSTLLAIAAVTAVLKDLLNNGVIDNDLVTAVGPLTISALPPDRIDITSSSQQSQLNLFMYQARPNSGWRNFALPSRNSDGDRLTNPPLALDLYYMLTAYGASEFHGEILLGYGMQLFHENAVLVRDDIRVSLRPPSPVPGDGITPEMQALFSSGLAEQVEQIKITPEPLSTEELSKLWSAFQVSYRPTAVYQVSCVLIESRRQVRRALPVRQRFVYVVPFSQPVIEQILSQENDTAPILSNRPILAGHTLVIDGTGLRGEDTLVRFGTFDVAPDPNDVTDRRIRVELPSSLTAGVQGVQVIHQLLMGSPPELHRGTESNVAAFILRPSITLQPLEDLQDDGGGFRSATVVLDVEPGISETQRVVLLLNEVNAPATRRPRDYGFSLEEIGPLSPPGTLDALRIPVSGVQTGSYLVRLQVDGVDSPLEADPSGRFVAPQVVL